MWKFKIYKTLNCICSNKKYDQICVVENIADMWVIESTGIYKGHYHILGGTLPSFENKKLEMDY